jgi:hypothetical protein
MLSIFQIGPHNDREQPQIDNTREENEYDWASVADVLMRHASKRNYVPPQLVVEHPSPELWEYFYEAGAAGQLISARLRDLIAPFSHPCFSFLPAYINGHEYYFFVSEESIDCLDREKSDILWSPSTSNKVLLVKRYAFHMHVLKDPLVFRIPEFSSRVFCTEGVKRVVDARQFRGIKFTQVAPLE